VTTPSANIESAECVVAAADSSGQEFGRARLRAHTPAFALFELEWRLRSAIPWVARRVAYC